jgi:hypothetical protein
MTFNSLLLVLVKRRAPDAFELCVAHKHRFRHRFRQLLIRQTVSQLREALKGVPSCAALHRLDLFHAAKYCVDAGGKRFEVLGSKMVSIAAAPLGSIRDVAGTHVQHLPEHIPQLINIRREWVVACGTLNLRSGEPSVVLGERGCGHGDLLGRSVCRNLNGVLEVDEVTAPRE